MKRIIFHLLVLAFSTNLLADDDDLFSFKAKLHFVNAIDIATDSKNKKYARISLPQINAEARLKSELTESISLDASFTSSAIQQCIPGYLLKKAGVSLQFHELFSIDAGCLKLEQGGWSNRGNSAFSPYDTSLTHEFWNKRYNKAINLNIHFIGAIRVQILEDGKYDRAETKNGPIALNTAWLMDLFGTQPIFQVGFYNSFKSFHFSVGIKAQLEDFYFKANFTRDHENHKNKANSKITQEEHVCLKYAAHQFANPYFKFQHKMVMKDGKTQENSGSPQNSAAWGNGGFLVSLGNHFNITDKVSSYINANYKWGKFSSENKSHWDIRLGLKGKI